MHPPAVMAIGLVPSVHSSNTIFVHDFCMLIEKADSRHQPGAQSILPLVVLLCGLATGCTTTPTDALNLGGNLPPPPQNATLSDEQAASATDDATRKPVPPPPGLAKRTGAYPNINEVPSGQTSFMTPAEKQQAQRELEGLNNRRSADEAARAKAEYDAEVSKMQRLLKEQEKKRRYQSTF